MTSIISGFVILVLSLGSGVSPSINISRNLQPGATVKTIASRPVPTQIRQKQPPVSRSCPYDSRQWDWFLQTDPIGYRDSMNLYQAFNMNPMNFVDPMGLYTKKDQETVERIAKEYGLEIARGWIAKQNFSDEDSQALNMGIVFGFYDPDAFSPIESAYSQTLWDIGKYLGLVSYMKMHAGVRASDRDLQAEGLSELLIEHTIGAVIGIGISRFGPQAIKKAINSITEIFPSTKPFIYKIVEKANKVVEFLTKDVKNLIFEGNKGYGFKLGDNIEIFYKTPNKGGGTIIQYKSGTSRWHIDIDPTDGFHFHFGKGKAGKEHLNFFEFVKRVIKFFSSEK
jgi:hypothetical protein